MDSQAYRHQAVNLKQLQAKESSSVERPAATTKQNPATSGTVSQARSLEPPQNRGGKNHHVKQLVLEEKSQVTHIQNQASKSDKLDS